MGIVDENGRYIPEQERKERYEREMARLKEGERKIQERMMELCDEDTIH
jgi:hypothetical protein